MDAEIIAVGSELLTPERIDTNSLFLTEKLNLLGIEVVGKAIIGDDLERLSAAVSAALSRSEIVITTGGLGPTEDDLTREAVASSMGRELVWRQEICDVIESRFRRMGRKMADVNKRQAYVIDGADVLDNDKGTAPGLWIEAGAKRVVAMLPGPPRELKPLFEKECLPRLERLAPPLAIRSVQFRVSGMPESDLDQLISPIYTAYEKLATTVLASPGDIQIHLRARCETAGEAEALLAEVAPRIEELLGDRLYSKDGATLEATVGALLLQRRATLAVAESCTGGMLAERITSAPGASAYFSGGFLVYARELKERLLGVPPALIDAHSVVSPEVAEAMAAGARERTGATYAISVTGEAGPESSTGRPPGTVFLGVAGPDGVTSRIVKMIGDRTLIRRRAVNAALDFFRRTLLSP